MLVFVAMQLTNKTAYDTKTLRMILTRVHAAESKRRGRLKTWERLHVTVVYSQGHRYTGHATLAGTMMRLRIPKPEHGVDLARFVALTQHELWHSYGIVHAGFSESVMRCLKDTEFVRGVCVDLPEVGVRSPVTWVIP